MDQRQTFDGAASLKTMLLQLSQQNAVVSFLVDAEGLTRVDGRIVSVEKNEQGREVVIVSGGQANKQYALEAVVAVNGIFRSDYTEC